MFEGTQEIIEQKRKEHDLPALGVSVLFDGQISSFASGVRKRGNETPVTTDDKFHFGSCGKAVSALLIQQLVGENRLKLSDRLEDIFTDQPLHPDIANIKVSQLLTHSAGLAVNYEGDMSLDKKDIISNILSDAPPTPKDQFEYSNVGYILLGAIAEKQTGKGYQTLVTERIFEPLNMQTAGFGSMADSASDIPNQPWGHSKENGQAINEDNPSLYDAAGRIHASMGDWMKFLQHRMENSYTLNHSQEVLTGQGSAYTSSGMHSLNNGAVLTHDGSNTLNRAKVVLLPKQQIAFCLTSNDGSKAAELAINEVSDKLAQEIASEIQKKHQPTIHKTGGITD